MEGGVVKGEEERDELMNIMIKVVTPEENSITVNI